MSATGAWASIPAGLQGPALHVSKRGITINIGMITDSLSNDSFETMLANAARMKMDMLEFACGNWSPAPHIELDRMLESDSARREFKAKVADHGIAISALN